MKYRYIFLFLLVGLLATMPVLAACDGDETETSINPTKVPFSIDVTPVIMEDTIVGQSCVFLVTVSDEEATGGESALVSISAIATGAAVTVGPKEIAPGSVSEVVVIPDETSIGQPLTVTIEGKRGEITETEFVTLTVQERPLIIRELATKATELRDRFIPWLEENHPDLDITGETEWTGAVIYPTTQDSIRYYLFFSENWEMGIRWQAVDGATNWVKIYLRLRTAELTPSEAFEISSVSANEDPQSITPPNAVWR
jgi:hypothetical protein